MIRQLSIKVPVDGVVSVLQHGCDLLLIQYYSMAVISCCFSITTWL